MAQVNDLEVAGGSGLEVRTRINARFAAVFSNNSGVAAPPETLPGMPWVDTAGGGTIPKLRNAADDGWVQLVTLTGVETLSGKTLTSAVLNGTVSGTALASQAEAEAGTATNKLMTPARVAQAIAALGGGITLDTAVTPSAVAAVDFPDIPAGVNRITVMFSALAIASTDIILIQLGDAGGIENTGYNSVGSDGSTGLRPTSGFIATNLTAGWTISGAYTLSRVSGNIWTGGGILFQDRGGGLTVPYFVSGIKTLSGELDLIRVLTESGSINLSAGTINVSWEF